MRAHIVAIMNARELAAIPEMKRFTWTEERQANGTMRRTPHEHPAFGVLYFKDDDPLLIEDARGVAWQVGWSRGKRWRIRI